MEKLSPKFMNNNQSMKKLSSNSNNLQKEVVAKVILSLNSLISIRLSRSI